MNQGDRCHDHCTPHYTPALLEQPGVMARNVQTIADVPMIARPRKRKDVLVMERERFQEFMRAQRQGRGSLSAKDMLRLLGYICLLASGCFWYPMQWSLATPQSPGDIAVVLAFGTFLVIGPPVFTSFFVPWSPSAQLLQKINAKTIGQAVAFGCTVFLLYYAYHLLSAWWSFRPVVAASNLVGLQTILGLIATIIAPALIWAPVSSEELEEVLKQDRLVKRYELQTQADLAYLQGMLLDAQRVATIGLANIAADERPQLAWQMQYLVESIDQTIQEIAHTVERTSGVVANFPNLQGNAEVVQVLDYVKDNLADIAPTDSTVSSMPPSNMSSTTTIPPSVSSPPRSDQQERMASTTPTSGQLLERLAPAPSPPAISRETAHAPAASGGPRQPQATGGEADRALATVREHVRGAWMRKHVQEILHIGETKAGDLIRSWKKAGLVEELTEPKHHYRFCSREEVEL